MRHRLRLLAGLWLAALAAGCGQAGATPSPPVYGYAVVGVLPHDPHAFTEGLVIAGGKLLESTGAFGGEPSSLREVDLRSGTVLRRLNLPSAFFGEGLTVIGDRVFQLTWRSQRGFVYDRRTLEHLADFTYAGEGWGLTNDGTSLIMSNGSDELRYLDPATFAPRRSVRVRSGGRPVTGLNELESVRGEIYANVFPGEDILRINPGSGEVLGRAEMRGLLGPARDHQDVLNGIAYEAAADRLYITGKRSPHLYEIRLIRR